LKKISEQVKESSAKEVEETLKRDGDFSQVISTGSTLLDLCISGGVVRGGGLPGGILVEIFGPPSVGKTSLLCEIAGNVQRAGGETKFFDPEARLKKRFAQTFDFELDQKQIEHPNTPLDIFPIIRKWKPKNTKIINGVFIDSTAALASDTEMEDKSDEFSRRAKLFSQECRKTCRPITQCNYLVVASNQLRQKMGATQFQEKTVTTGGEAIPFYASLRLKLRKALKPKITQEEEVAGKTVKKVIGISTEVEVYKSSVWKAYESTTIHLLNNYGIDDIRSNLQFLKTFTEATVYQLNELRLDKSLDISIGIIESENKEIQLKEAVIDLWEEIESKFKADRKPKVRSV